MSNVFNNQGQLNASNVREAFELIAKLAASMQDGVPSGATLQSSVVSDAKRDELISRALLGDHSTKTALAQSMANPIRRNLDYQGIARRALVVDALSQGALPVYDRDIDVSACVISSNGSPPESRIFGERITVPEFDIASNPTVRISEVRRRRFNVIDRAVQKARQEIMAQEDSNVFAALDTAGQADNVLQDITDTGLLKRDLINLKQQIDQWDLLTTKYFMNISEFTDILRWGSGGGQGSTGGDVDPVTQREILQTGIQAKLWGADIMVSKIVPPGSVYACTDAEFVGVMPIRQDIEVLPADEPRQLKLGWVVSETIGIGITNARGVSVGRKSAGPA